MKKLLKLTLTLLILNTLYLIPLTAQVGINNDNSEPDASAMLDVKSDSKGMLVPRMTSSQRTQISNAATGLLVFDTTTESFWFKDSNVWVELVSGNIAVLVDADSDTKIQVEESADEDAIRFDIEGDELFRMEKNTNGRTLLSVSDGYDNIYIGDSVATIDNSNTPEQPNTIIGNHSLKNNTTGYGNVALGYKNLENNTTGRSNIALGNRYVLRQNTNGTSNIGIGSRALQNNTSGGLNIGIGNLAGENNQGGVNNILIGAFAGEGTTLHNKSSNVMIGVSAGTNNEGDGNIFLGYEAGRNETGSNKLYIENSRSSSPLIYGEFDNDLLRINGTLNINNAFSFPIADGTNGQILQTDGSGATSWATLIDNDNQTLSFDGTNLSIADGNSVDLSSINSVQSIIEDADSDTKIQVEESADEDVIRFDIENIEVGRFSKNANNNNAGLFIGNNNNTFLNVNPSNNTGNQNTFIGEGAGSNNISGTRNTLLGRQSGFFLNDGHYNVFLGTEAGKNNSSGLDNVFIGDGSGFSNTDGSRNVAIGSGTGTNNLSGSRNVFIGDFAGANETSSDRLYIESSPSSSPLIYGEFDNNLVRINGDLEVTGSSNLVPVGTIIMWIGDENETVPEGWLICDNRLYNTTTYPDLFALLGTDRTPNFLGRFPVGAPRDGINGATGISVGGTGGEEDKTLDVANLPPHSHGINFREGSESGNGNDYSDINADTNDASGSTESTGDGESFKIMPPFLGVQFLIKAE